MVTTATYDRDAVGVLARPINRWWFVVTGFLCLIVGVNIIYTLFNVLGAPIRDEFGWTPFELSAGLTYFLVADGISVFVMGLLINRFGLRRVTVPLAAVFGLALASLALMPPSLAYLYIACIVAGLAVGPSTQVAHSIVVTGWFGKNRGLALGILNVGLGLCGTLTPFAVNALLDGVGWRSTFAIVGLACGLIPVIAFALIVRMPAGFEQARREAAREKRAVGIPLLTIMRTSKAFWLISVSILLVSMATTGVLGQVVAITTGQGADTATALSILSTVSLSSIGSRFLVGWLLDRMWAPALAAVMFVVCGAGVALLTQSTATPLLFLGAVLVGAGLGSEGDIAAYVTSRYIPELSYARVYGFVIFLFAQGSAIGVFVLGLSITVTGSVDTAAWGIVTVSVIAGLMLLLLGPYQYGVDGSKKGNAEVSTS